MRNCIRCVGCYDIVKFQINKSVNHRSVYGFVVLRYSMVERGMLMDAMKTGNFIAKKRKERNMSQRELAEYLHITDKAISKWERGLSFPDITVLIPLSEVLQVSVYDLLTGGSDNG